MIHKKVNKLIYLLVVIMSLSVVVGNLAVNKAYAYRHNDALSSMTTDSDGIDSTTEQMDMREVEIYGTLLYVYTNQEKEFILIRGVVSDWTEMEKIEGYFTLRAPSTYRLIYDIHFMQ